MNAAQVRTFIREVNGSNNPFDFYDPKSKKWKHLSDFGAWLSPDNIIYLNKEYWQTIDDDEQKCLLIHEIGHIHDPSNYNKNKVKRELFAQMWAIRRSKQLKLFDLYDINKYFLKSWKNFEWNSNQRRYILAYRLAKKKRLI